MGNSVALVFRFGLATLFVGSALVKFGDRPAFVEAVRQYELLPRRIAPAFALAVLIGEFLVGAALGLGLAASFGAVLAALLLLTFACAMVVNLVRGRMIECGCAGGVLASRISWRMVARNAALSAAAVWVLRANPDSVSIDHWIAGGGSQVPSSDVPAAVIIGTLAVVSATVLAAATRAGLAARRVGAGWPR